MTGAPAPVTVAYQDLDVTRLRQHAHERHQGMLAAATAGTHGAYGRSTPRMHEVGLSGEYALVYWLEHNDPALDPALDHAVHLIGDDPSIRTAGDVAVVRHHHTGERTATTPNSGSGRWVSDWVTFEVKTSREPDWQVYARTLDAAQLARSTANAYVWAVLQDQWGATSVRLMGWLPLDDIRATGATRPACVHDRPHVRVHAPMRPMRDLPTWIAEQPSLLDCR